MIKLTPFKVNRNASLGSKAAEPPNKTYFLLRNLSSGCETIFASSSSLLARFVIKGDSIKSSVSFEFFLLKNNGAYLVRKSGL